MEAPVGELTPKQSPIYLTGREVHGLTGEALREERECTCGAGHGSGENHTVWCAYEPKEPARG